MIVLILILIVILFIGLYPVVRDALRRRQIAMPAYTEGLALLVEGKKEVAREKFRQACLADSNNIDAYLRLAELYEAEGDEEQAGKIYETLTLRRTLDKNQEKKIYQSLGNLYLKTLRWAKALPIFEELVRIDKHDLKNFEILLKLYERTERFEAALEIIKKLTRHKLNKERISYYYASLGKAISQKDPAKASEYYKTALAYNPFCVPALIYQGEYFYTLGELEKAGANWRMVLENNPEYNFLIRDKIEAVYYELGKYEEVASVYSALLKKLPLDPTLYVALAQIYEKKEDIKQAISVLARAPMVGSRGYLAQLRLIALYLKDGAIKKGECVLNQLIEALASGSATLRFRCQACGFETKQFEWQCPKCWAWDSIKGEKIEALNL